jgi:hypothetical protein
VLAFFQACADAAASEIEKSTDAQLRAQKLAELQEIITAWPKLPPELRTACLAVTRAANLGAKLTGLRDIAQTSD